MPFSIDKRYPGRFPCLLTGRKVTAGLGDITGLLGMVKDFKFSSDIPLSLYAKAHKCHATTSSQLSSLIQHICETRA